MALVFVESVLQTLLDIWAVLQNHRHRQRQHDWRGAYAEREAVRLARVSPHLPFSSPAEAAYAYGFASLYLDTPSMFT